jgi:hypothetical protein
MHTVQQAHHTWKSSLFRDRKSLSNIVFVWALKVFLGVDFDQSRAEVFKTFQRSAFTCVGTEEYE